MGIASTMQRSGGVLDRAGVTLNSPDHLFYLTLDEQAALRGEGPPTERGS